MKINPHTWHFWVFDAFNRYGASYYSRYEKVTDCDYVRKVFINSILVVICAALVLACASLFLAMMLEPILVGINWMLGNGFEPVIGQFVNKPDALLHGGIVLYVIFGLCFLVYGIHKLNNVLIERSGRIKEPSTGFLYVLFERYKSWKGKYCKLVEFDNESDTDPV